MSVAPSFEKYPIVGDPFTENNKEYVYIQYPDGHQRKVRWYEEPMKQIKSTKEILGFKNGYIIIFKGDTYSLLDWFRESVARYHSLWGWYFTSEDELPEFPAGIEPITLKWEDVADGENLKPEDTIKQYIESLVYEPSTSEWQGEIGERIDRRLTVTKAITLENGYYGSSTMHIFEDEDGNEYVWTTASKSLEVDKAYAVRGTIKDLKVYKNKKQTILTRCRIGE